MSTQWVPKKLADDFYTWFSEGTWQWQSDKCLANKNGPNHQNKSVESNIESNSLVSQPVASQLATQSPSIPSTPYNLTASQHFEIRVSPKGGYGAFATEFIPVNTKIIRESPLIEGRNENFLEAFSRLSAVEKDMFKGLHGYDKIDADRLMAIFKTNRFATPHGNGGIFLVASRFNHSCVPPCTYRFDEAERKLVVTAVKPIATGEEITISYGQCPFDLLENYGFICDCGDCSLPVNMELLNRPSVRSARYDYNGTDYSDQWRMSGHW